MEIHTSCNISSDIEGNTETAASSDILVPLYDGSSVLVKKSSLEGVKGSNERTYATQLFTLIFSFKEAKESSTSGKGKDPKTGNKPKMLSEKKLEAMKVLMKRKYPNMDWKDIWASIDTKSRGVRSGKYDKCPW